jgi:hypothetical protein
MKRTFNRRAFLQRLGAAAIAAVAAPLIEPVRIFVPAPQPMSIVPVDWLTKETLAVLENNLHFHKSAFSLRGEHFKVGDTITIRTPERLSMRFVQQYTVNADVTPSRLDVLYGMGVIEPDLMVRIEE